MGRFGPLACGMAMFLPSPDKAHKGTEDLAV
jgi:hypothetical protein